MENVAYSSLPALAPYGKHNISSLPALAPYGKRIIFHVLDHLNITKYDKGNQQEPHPPRFPLAGSVIP